MSFTRFLLLCAATCSLSGCAFLYSHEPEKRYSLVHVTDIEGRLISDWIAEGFVEQTDHGYRFKAMERISGPPYPQHVRYPHGRDVEIRGPNMIVTRCGKPLWLYHLEYK